jgi:response regulator of citrate/malate metabolism
MPLEASENIAQPKSQIKVAIVEDRREIREGLAMLINGTDGFHCSGSYRSMEEALDNIARTCPMSCLTILACQG